MEEDTVEYVIQRALRDDFDNAHRDRQIEIYKACKAMNYKELTEEMRQDLNSDYNLQLT